MFVIPIVLLLLHLPEPFGYDLPNFSFSDVIYVYDDKGLCSKKRKEKNIKPVAGRPEKILQISDYYVSTYEFSVPPGSTNRCSSFLELLVYTGSFISPAPPFSLIAIAPIGPLPSYKILGIYFI